MFFKKRIKVFGIVNLVFMLMFVSVLIIYDPLHIYHQSWITEGERFHGNMRLQAAGIINNYSFDAVIAGTSMMKGTSARQASQLFGGMFVNLSMDGASTIERKYIIDYAIKNQQIRKVIISFDTGLDQNLKVNRKFPVENFDFLYDKYYFNDIKAYWNDKFIACLVTWSKSTDCIGESRQLQKPAEWFDKIYEINSKISGVENWVHAEGGRGPAVYSRVKRHLERPIKSESTYNKKLTLTKKIIDDSLFSIINENKDVEFYVVFPPYSRFLYSLWRNKNPYKYQLYLETIRYLVNKGAMYNNLTVYSFDDMAYLDNLNNYRDMRHYNTDMNERMLTLMAEKKGVIRPDSLESFIQDIDSKNANYKLDNELNYLINNYTK